jgi:hypothetical protein
MPTYTNMVGTLAMPLEARLLGEHASDDLYDSGVAFADGFQLWVHVTATTATSVLLDCGVQTSTDGETWTFLDGSQITSIVPPGGNSSSNAVTDAPHVRVFSQVEGEDDGETLASMTYRVFVVAPAVAA